MKPFKITRIFYFILLIIFSIKVFAYTADLPVDWVSQNFSSLGGASTAISNDETAIYSNPAGLSLIGNSRSRSYVRDFRVSLSVGANNLALQNATENPDNWVNDMLTTAINHPTNNVYTEIQVYPEIILGMKKGPSFLIGAPIRLENRILVVDSNNLSIADVKSISTYSGVLGIAYASDTGAYKIGFSVRPNYRIDYETTNYDVTQNNTKSYADITNSNGIKTYGMGLDFGLMMTVADYWFPTLGFSVRNIPTGCINNYINPITQKQESMCGSIRTGATDTNLAPNTSLIDPTEIRAGVSLTPRGKIGRQRINLRLSADIYPIPIQVNQNNYGINDQDFSKLLHAGAELFFGQVLQRQGLSIRGGVINEEPTWGASIQLIALTLDYSSYMADANIPQVDGTVKTISERRHLMGVSIHF